MRTIKKHDERRTEILDTAEKLFATKGYEKCTINDILKAVDIAKGTFYYYFKPKREVLDAIVSRYNDIIIERINEIIDSPLSPETKFLEAFMAMNVQQKVGEVIMDEIHRSENVLLHQNILTQIILKVGPLLQKIIEEGIEKRQWECKFPLEYMQIFLAASLTLIDEESFNFDETTRQRILTALITLLEKMLCVPENSFLKLCFEQSK